MPITLKDLTELRHKISEGRKKLEEQEAALRVLEGMISESELISSGSQQNDIDLGGVHVFTEPGKKALITLVREVVQRLGDQEFSVPHIEAVLKQQGTLPKSKTPRASIAMALNKLKDKNEVIRTHKGTGNEPHRFKKAVTTDVAKDENNDSKISFI